MAKMKAKRISDDTTESRWAALVRKIEKKKFIATAVALRQPSVSVLCCDKKEISVEVRLASNTLSISWLTTQRSLDKIREAATSLFGISVPPVIRFVFVASPEGDS